MTDVQGRINEYWDLRAESYDGSAGHGFEDDDQRRSWLEALSRLLPAAPADVLDVGTGTGAMALLAADLGHVTTGVDLSEGMLEVARTKVGPRSNVSFRIGDAVEPPFEPQSFDVVLSRHVVWTLHDPEAAARHWRRLLRPGGRVVAIDGLWEHGTTEAATPPTPPTPPAPITPVADAWSRLYSAETRAALPLMAARSLDPVVRVFEEAGFEDVTVVPFTLEPSGGGAPRYCLSARRPAAGELTIRRLALDDVPQAKALVTRIYTEMSGPEVVERWHTDIRAMETEYVGHARQAGFIAVQDGDVVGTLFIRHRLPTTEVIRQRYDPATTCEVGRVTVAHALRRHGIARQLFAAASGWAHDEGGFTMLNLHTEADNVAALALWRGLCEEVATIDDTVFFERPLA